LRNTDLHTASTRKKNREPLDRSFAEPCSEKLIYTLLLPEGKPGRTWEHSTDNALSKIVAHWAIVPRNTVWETLQCLRNNTYCFYQKVKWAESGNIPQIILFRKSGTNGYRITYTLSSYVKQSYFNVL